MKPPNVDMAALHPMKNHPKHPTLARQGPCMTRSDMADKKASVAPSTTESR
jgi:hypothetical protein